MTAQDLISTYRLEPHPEGGWFREFFRSDRMLGKVPGYPGGRVALTGIYFLLTRQTFSAFHRIRGEEPWIHLAGATLELVLLDRQVRRVRVAPVTTGGEPITVVPGGAIQGARTLGDFTLVACLVAPGFEFDDFDLLKRQDLLIRFPRHAEVIRAFTR